MSEPRKKPPTDWSVVGRNPYFAIGIVFFAVSIVFFVNESMRTFGFVFLPLGIVFFSLAVSGTGATKSDSEGTPDPGNDPDSPPAPPER